MRYEGKLSYTAVSPALIVAVYYKAEKYFWLYALKLYILCHYVTSQWICAVKMKPPNFIVADIIE